jgi:hypothetical protein
MVIVFSTTFNSISVMVQTSFAEKKWKMKQRLWKKKKSD